MKFFLIKENLQECRIEDIEHAESPYCAIMTPEEYTANKDVFQMGIDMDLDLRHVMDTKVIVNFDSLTGTLNIPDNFTFSYDKFKIAFAMDEKGIVLIDTDTYAENLVDNIRLSRKWRLPSLERFVYDFLEETMCF
jgi:magnesium transporter